MPIVVGGHLEAAARRAGRLGDSFFPSIGAQLDTMPLLDIVRRSAQQAGRDPAMVQLILGAPARCRIPAPTRARPLRNASRGARVALRCQ